MVARRQDGTANISLVGSALGSDLGPVVSTYKQGRVCTTDGCETVLSVYNPSKQCWQHETPKRVGPAPPGRPRKERELEEIAQGVWVRPA